MSQEDKILEYLQAGNYLTPITALEKFGCFRLGARCFELRRKGYNIQSEIVKGDNRKHFSRYWLSDEPLPTEQEQAICHSNKIAEDRINFKAIKGQLSFV